MYELLKITIHANNSKQKIYMKTLDTPNIKKWLIANQHKSHSCE